MEQEIIEMKNIVEKMSWPCNITQLYICDPNLGRVYYRIKYGKVW